MTGIFLHETSRITENPTSVIAIETALYKDQIKVTFQQFHLCRGSLSLLQYPYSLPHIHVTVLIH